MHPLTYIAVALVFLAGSAALLHAERKSRLWYQDRLMHGLAWSCLTMAAALFIKGVYLLLFS